MLQGVSVGIKVPLGEGVRLAVGIGPDEVGLGVGVKLAAGVTVGPLKVGEAVQVGPPESVADGVLVRAVEEAVAVGGSVVAVWQAREALTAVGSRLGRFHDRSAASYCPEAAHGSAEAISRSP